MNTITNNRKAKKQLNRAFKSLCKNQKIKKNELSDAKEYFYYLFREENVKRWPWVQEEKTMSRDEIIIKICKQMMETPEDYELI